MPDLELVPVSSSVEAAAPPIETPVAAAAPPTPTNIKTPVAAAASPPIETPLAAAAASPSATNIKPPVAATASPSVTNIKPPVAATAAASPSATNIKPPVAAAAATTSGNSVGIQWIILVVLSAIPIAIWAFAPSYGNTMLSAFFTTLSIFGGILCLIAAVSIMMNIYKNDGTAIMLMMGLLGAVASPLIVVGYWVYHLWSWTQSIKPRPYFGLFPIGFHGSLGSFWDSFLAPFHDSSNDKKLYEFLLKDANNILYGNPRD